MTDQREDPPALPELSNDQWHRCEGLASIDAVADDRVLIAVSNAMREGIAIGRAESSAAAAVAKVDRRSFAWITASAVMGTTTAEHGGPTDDVLEAAINAYLTHALPAAPVDEDALVQRNVEEIHEIAAGSYSLEAKLEVAFRYGLRAALPAAVPDHMVLVPREPTAEMIGAGYDAQSEAGRQSLIEAWPAMLAAAQPAPEEPR